MARSKGTGTLIKKGKYYLAKWIVNGQIFYRSTKCTKKEDALKKLHEFTHPFQIKSDIEQLENISAKIRSDEHQLSLLNDEFADCEIKDILDKYYSLANSNNVSEHTRDLYNAFLVNLLKFISSNKLNVKYVKDVDKQFCEKFLTYQKSKKSSSGYNCELALYKRIWSEFKNLSKHKCFKTNPWDGFKYMSSEGSYRRNLTVEELAKLLQATSDNELLNLLFCIGLYTGMRKSDCCSLKWCEIDFIKNVICKIPIKTKRKRKEICVPMHDVLRGKLLWHRKRLEDRIARGEEVYDEEKEYVSYDLFRKYNLGSLDPIIRRLFKKVGIKTREKIDGKMKTVVSFHSLRHSFVSMASTAGIPLNIVKHIVGHTTSSMTEHYNHINVLNFSSAIQQLPTIDGFNQNIVDNQKVSIEIDSEIVSKISRMTSKSIEDILNEFILANEKKASEDVVEVL